MIVQNCTGAVYVETSTRHCGQPIAALSARALRLVRAQRGHVQLRAAVAQSHDSDAQRFKDLHKHKPDRSHPDHDNRVPLLDSGEQASHSLLRGYLVLSPGATT